MWEILYRYFFYNIYVVSYIWKFEGKNLNMDYILEENGIQDEEEEFDFFIMDSIFYISVILFYFNDDFIELQERRCMFMQI